MAKKVFYESIEEEEILFQPQGMSVEYVAKIENKVAKVEKKVESIVGDIIDYKICPIKNKLCKCEKIGGGVWWSDVNLRDKHRPSNFQILMLLCNM